MSEDEKEPLSAVDVAYPFIHEADDDWTKEKLLPVPARAGFPLDHEAELDDILEAVLECLEYEFGTRRASHSTSSAISTSLTWATTEFKSSTRNSNSSSRGALPDNARANSEAFTALSWMMTDSYMWATRRTIEFEFFKY